MLDLAAISQILNQIYAPRISDQLNQRTTLLSKMTKNIADGKNIAFDAKVARNPAGGSYASGADLTFTGNEYDVEVPAILGLKRLRVPFQVAGDALAVAARSGPDALTNLFHKQMEDASRNLSVILGAQVYSDGTGNGGLDYDGLLAALGSTTGTYAGVSRVTYPIWAPNYYANGGVGRALTEALLLQAETDIFTYSGMMPDLIVTTPALHQTYETLFTSTSIVRQESDKATYNLGAKELNFKGIPVIRDARCPAGKLFMLTFDSFSLEQWPSIPMADGVQLDQGTEMLMNADGTLGIQVSVELLGKTGDAVKGFVKLYANFKVEHPNRNALIADLT